MKKLSNIYFFYDYWSIFKRRYRDLSRRSSGKTKRKYHAAKLKDDKLTYAEFIDWCWDKNNFKTFEDLYKQWEDNNFIKKYSPSIDRIDSQGTYTLDNIQWLSLGENARKHDK